MNENDLKVDKATYNYGSGENNPIDAVKFYDETYDQYVSFHVKKEDVSNSLPNCFQDYDYRLYYTGKENEIPIKRMQKAFAEHFL
jgi:hypothetical protein